MHGAALVGRSPRIHRNPPHVRDDWPNVPRAEAGWRETTIKFRKTEAKSLTAPIVLIRLANSLFQQVIENGCVP
jgi:hypothetical protein